MKRPAICAVFVLGLIISSNAQKIGGETLCGTFYKLKKDKYFSSSYTLVLRPDSSFTFIVMVEEAKPQCEGRWKLVDNKFILLDCSEMIDPIERLSRSYMYERDYKLQVINKNKIKYRDFVLKRKK